MHTFSLSHTCLCTRIIILWTHATNPTSCVYAGGKKSALYLIKLQKFFIDTQSFWYWQYFFSAAHALDSSVATSFKFRIVSPEFRWPISTPQTADFDWIQWCNCYWWLVKLFKSLVYLEWIPVLWSEMGAVRVLWSARGYTDCCYDYTKMFGRTLLVMLLLWMQGIVVQFRYYHVQ